MAHENCPCCEKRLQDALERIKALEAQLAAQGHGCCNHLHWPVYHYPQITYTLGSTGQQGNLQQGLQSGLGGANLGNIVGG